MKIADGIEMLELQVNMLGNKMTIHPTLFYDEHQAVLVDVGAPGQLDEIREAIAKAGVPFEHISGIILTHQDIDHVGSIQAVLKSAAKPLAVYAHADDKPYIEGDKEPIKMTKDRVQQLLARLPEEVRAQAEAFFQNRPTANVTDVVADGDVIPLFGGIQIVFTPGHTPGHISLYHQPTKTLIAGDATVSENGILKGLNQQATPDMERALQSLKKFTTLDIERVICYHGGLCDQNVNQQFQDLTKDQ